MCLQVATEMQDLKIGHQLATEALKSEAVAQAPTGTLAVAPTGTLAVTLTGTLAVTL